MSAPAARLDHAILQQAADWFARLQEAPYDPQLRARWQDWLDEGESCQLAWSYIERVSQRFGHLHGQGPLAHQTLASLRNGKCSRRQVLGLAGGGLLLGCLGWRLRWMDDLQSLQADYRTGIGESRYQRLADGTQLWLNSGSALDVRFDARQRSLHLYAGEVMIETAHESRPFSVRTAAGTLTPLGTRFSVRQEGGRTRLNVYQGAVQASCSKSRRSATAQAGQRLVFDEQQLGPLEAAQLQRESWTRGLLLAEDMSLGEFVDELGRHRRGHLGLDPAIRDLRVMGSFSLRDTDQALAQLEEVLPVKVSRRFDWWVTLEPR
ncbi:FecR family protein [Pseudomonas sp.]|uniref:FecR family protein n=1 Tax=Pseudomonas sp. TaxID=306 RepID=UPI0028A86FCB|nr:FecR family protein [Pseudomonas sp.]